MKMSELKKFDAVLRMSRFSTKRKGCDKKRLSKKLVVEKLLFRIELVVEWVFKWFIVYLLIGEFLFLTVGWILPTFIF